MKVLNVQVALVPGNLRNWLDRRIMEMDPKTNYTHAGFILTLQDRPAEWWDVHHRWFTSSLRRFPVANYSWPYDLWSIKGLTPEDCGTLGRWLIGLEGWRINYDFLSCVVQYGAFKLGLPSVPTKDTPSVLRCFELIQRGLERAGRVFTVPAEQSLGYDLVMSGHLEKATS